MDDPCMLCGANDHQTLEHKCPSCGLLGHRGRDCKCVLCNLHGHIAERCPKVKRFDESKCQLCGGSDHVAAEHVCPMCGLLGHRGRDCQKPDKKKTDKDKTDATQSKSKKGSEAVRCDLCGSRHKTEDHKCSNCSRTGHRSRFCPLKGASKVEGDIVGTCQFCGSHAHTTDDHRCPTCDKWGHRVCCGFCGVLEHAAETCQAKARHDLQMAKCQMCGSDTHKTEEHTCATCGLVGHRVCCELCGALDHTTDTCHGSHEPGKVWAFGWNDHGQLANENNGSHYVPRLIKNITDIVLVSCGNLHSAFITSQGKLYTFGSGSDGKLGHGTLDSLRSPKLVETLDHVEVTNVACSDRHTIACTATALFSWGARYFGMLGFSAIKNQLFPRQLNLPANYFPLRSLSAFGPNNAIVAKNGHLLVCGSGARGQLGDGNTRDFWTFTIVERFRYSPVVSVSVGGEFMFALCDDGRVFSWGCNDNGQLGIGSKSNRSSPCPVEALNDKKVSRIACGVSHAVALLRSGEVLLWGRGDLGLAQGTSQKGMGRDVMVPKSTGLIGVLDVKCGSNSVIALTKRGELYSWGSNKHGQLGLAFEESSAVKAFSLVERLAPVSSLSCGGGHTMILISDRHAQAQQHLVDGCDAEFKELLPSLSDTINNPINTNGFSLLHLATQMDRLEAVDALLSLSTVDPNCVDQLGQTPLHYAVLHSEKCVERLLNHTRTNVDAVDNNGNSALHSALLASRLSPAILLISAANPDGINRVLVRNNVGKRALDCLPFEKQVDIKKAAGHYDVALSCPSGDAKFAEQLILGLASFHITCRYDETLPDREDFMDGVCALVFVVSYESVDSSSQNMQDVYVAKAADLPMFPIWREKLELESDLESLIFRRQLVDFSAEAHFETAMSQLASGIHPLLIAAAAVPSAQKAQDDDDTESNGGSDASEDAEGGLSLFVSYDSSDSQFAQDLILAFELSGMACFYGQSASQNLKRQGDAVVSSLAFLLLLSKASVTSTVVKDQLALAENHHKPIIVVGLETDVVLDSSLQYTLAMATVFPYYGDLGETVMLLKASIAAARSIRHSVRTFVGMEAELECLEDELARTVSGDGYDGGR